MKIEHLAIWCTDLEPLREFYETYFGAISSPKYSNPTKGFESYFLTFGSGARLELMYRETVRSSTNAPGDERCGLAHFAIAVGSESAVDELTERIASDGYIVVGEPRRTGDGYYESVVLDPEGNRIEITV